MPRSVTAGFLSEIQSGNVRDVKFVSIEHATGTLYYCSAGYNLTWNGQTWIGDGTLRDMSPIPESEDDSGTFEVQLAAESLAMMAVFLQSFRQNKLVRVYIALLNAAGAIIADPHLRYVGKLDVPELADSKDDATISLNYIHIAQTARVEQDFRWNHATQQLFHDGDLAFEYVDELSSGYEGYFGIYREPKKKRGKNRGNKRGRK